MPYTKDIPQWNATGTKPPQSLIDNGWEFNQKPPADYFNWQWNAVYQVLNELHQFALHSERLAVANGIATLGSDGRLTSGQVPTMGTGNLANGSVTNDKLATDVKVGSLASLTTTAKGSVTAAINDVKSLVDSHTGNNTVHITAAERTTWNAKASTAVATTSSNGLMSSTDKAKLDGVATGANNYTHPATHPPSIILQDSTNRFVTDLEKATWNAKETPDGAQSKADAAESNAKNPNITAKPGTDLPSTYPDGYSAMTISSHTGWPSLYGVVETYKTASRAVQFFRNHNAPNIWFRTRTTSDAWANFTEVASTEAVTTSTNGLMTAADKTKLNGIATNANNYIHPATHPPSIIAQDASNRFVTDTEKTNWNAKASTTVATTNANGLMSSLDKMKLDELYANPIWQNITLQNGWLTYDANTTPQFEFGAKGIVTLRGAVRDGTLDVIAATLPVGARPIRNTYILVPGFTTSSNIFRIEVNPNGQIYIRQIAGSNKGFVAFDGISFSTLN